MNEYQDSVIGTWYLKRTKTKYVRATFNKAGHLEVRAPMRIPVYQVKTFVAKHRQWVKKNQPPKRQYKYGDMVIDAEIVKTSNTTISFDKKKNQIQVGSSLDVNDPEVQSEIDKVAAKVVTDYAKERLNTIASDIAAVHGFKPSRIGVRAMSSRWGSCSSKGRINLSSYLVFLEPELVEYVILHELTHLKHLNHSKRFWNALEKVWPNYKESRKQLRNIRPMVMLNTTPKLI